MGSSNSWISAAECTKGGSAPYEKLDVKYSSTSSRISSLTGDPSAAFTEYGTRACVLQRGRDSEQIDGSQIPNQATLLAVEESTHPFADLPFDGLLGLGSPDVVREEWLPFSALPIVDQMVKEQVSDPSIFSVYVSEDINRPERSSSATREKCTRIFVERGGDGIGCVKCLFILAVSYESG